MSTPIDKDCKQSGTITFRLPIGLLEQIREDYNTAGDFNSMSQWLNSACREYLQIRARRRMELKNASESIMRGPGGGGPSNP